MEIKISYDGREITKKLNSISSGVRNFKEPLEDSGTELQTFFGKKVFDAQGFSGQKWRKLSPRTLMMRAKRQGHYENPPITTGKILVWTGALSKGYKKITTKTTLIIRNVVHYFKYNQGARPMLGINKEVISIVTKNFIRYIKKITK